MKLCHTFGKDADLVEANYRLSMAGASLDSVKNIFDLVEGLSENIQRSTCSSISCGAFCVHLRLACELVFMISAKVVFGLKLSYQMARDGWQSLKLSKGIKLRTTLGITTRYVLYVPVSSQETSLTTFPDGPLDANSRPRMVFQINSNTQFKHV